LHLTHVTGSIPFLNPTHAAYRATTSTTSHQSPKTSNPRQSPGIYRLWRARDTRKGRHALRIVTAANHSDVDTTKTQRTDPQLQPPPSTKTTPQIQIQIQKPRRRITPSTLTKPLTDLPTLTALLFLVGSVIWILNAFFVWLPLQDPASEFAGEEIGGGGWTAFIGAAVFEVGSWGLVLEAVSVLPSGDDRCWGWGVETAIRENSGEATTLVLQPTTSPCICRRAGRRGFLGMRLLRQSGKKDNLHELGFLASLTQLVGASIFWIAGFTGLPGIINHMGPALTDGVYWVPQVVGGVCFVVSGGLFTLETQERWDRPAWTVLGWHIGVWNVVGGVGFTLCGVFGLAGLQYQACLATFWGSWAFLWASALQCYESLEKWPVE
ncbi:uncharacterized protein BO97DRAFT_307632, partial [Aspergillus homomorphus CBS 101889]